MKCYSLKCDKEASTKIGSAEGSMLSAFLPKFITKIFKWKTWQKSECYYCRKCYDRLIGDKK